MWVDSGSVQAQTRCCVPGSGARPQGGEADSHHAPARGTDRGGPCAHDAGRVVGLMWIRHISFKMLQVLGCQFYIELTNRIKAIFHVT